MADSNASFRPTPQTIGVSLLEISIPSVDYGPTTTNTTDLTTRSVSLGILFTVIIILIICGNILVCLSPWVNIMLRTATYTLLVSLAMVDLLLGLTVLPFSAIFTISQTWDFGPIFCNIYVSCDVLFSTASILHLLVISLDRYVAIVRPYTYKTVMTRKMAFFGIAIVWCISFLISFLPIHLGWNTKTGEVQSYKNPTECQLETNKLFALLDGILLFFVPLTLMSCVYCKIVVVARKQAKAIAKLSAQFNNNRRKQHIKVVDEHKALKVMAIVMGCFVVCWVPYFTIFTFQPLFQWKLPNSTYFVVLWMGYINSMINPLVYAALNSEFRKAFSILIYMAKNRTSDRRLSNGSMVTLRVNADRNTYERVERHVPSVCWDPNVDDINIPIERSLNGIVFPIVEVQTSNERNSRDITNNGR